MRVTIIVEDGYVSVDGVGISGIDMSGIPANVHAVQFYDNWGELEIVDEVTRRHVDNQSINSLAAFQAQLQQHAELAALKANLDAEALAQEQQSEV